MTILIVDDQSSVVSGIVSGVNWENLGIGIVLTAYGAQEAKALFERREIDMMLCDIEMPVEDGMSLFRWVRSRGIPVLTIFLTAHAEFMYAREALRLGGFDYIVQPARYEDIEAALRKAVSQIGLERSRKKYYSYGKLWYEKKDLLLEGMLRSWVRGEYTDPEDINTAFANLDIREDTAFSVLLFEVIGWEKNVLLEGKLLRYTFENMLTELFGGIGQTVVLIRTDEAEYAALIHGDGTEGANGRAPDKEVLHWEARVFQESCQRLFQCRVACYTGERRKKSEWEAGALAELLHLKADNVAGNTGVFDTAVHDKPVQERFLPFKKEWAGLMEDGYVSNVKVDILEYLDRKVEGGKLNGRALKLFYHEFMNLVYRVGEEQGVALKDIFPDDTQMELSFQAYGSVDKMKEFVENVLSYFASAAAGEDNAEGQIAKIVRYIHDNIENDIRRADIAEAIYLNPDYVSRIFKKGTGMSLKEFIIGEKMKVAQTLLRTTNLSVSLIAAKVGYTNFSHFSQTYKKVMNRTPAEERQQDR